MLNENGAKDFEQEPIPGLLQAWEQAHFLQFVDKVSI